MTSEKQEAANSNVKSSEQVSPSQPSKMVTPDVPSKWIEVYEDGWYSLNLMLHSRRITFPEFDRKQFHISILFCDMVIT